MTKAEYDRAYYLKNKERRMAQHATYRAENKDKLAAYDKAYRESDMSKGASKTALRRSRQAQRTPPCADLKEIEKVFAAARFIHEELGYELPHVDHIVPLHGKTVSGLHIHTNLQLLSAKDNLSKSNSFEELV